MTCDSDAVGVEAGVEDSDHFEIIVLLGVRVAVCDIIVKGVERSEPEEDALTPYLRDVVRKVRE